MTSLLTLYQCMERYELGHCIAYKISCAPSKDSDYPVHLRSLISLCRALSSQGPVVQSIVSLTSSLRVISLTVLADSIYNILIVFAEKM